MGDTKASTHGDQTASLLTKRAAIMTRIRELKLETSKIDQSLITLDPLGFKSQIICW